MIHSRYSRTIENCNDSSLFSTSFQKKMLAKNLKEHISYFLRNDFSNNKCHFHLIYISIRNWFKILWGSKLLKQYWSLVIELCDLISSYIISPKWIRIRKAKGNYSCNFILNERSCSVRDHWETTRCKEGTDARAAENEFYPLMWHESAKRAHSYVSRNFPRGTDPFNIRLSIAIKCEWSRLVTHRHFYLRKSNASYLLALSDFLLCKYHISQVNIGIFK